jgi:hypothetical protein
MTNYYTYDLEVFPNIFLFGGKFKDSNEVQLFEISDRMNQLNDLLNWLSYLKNCQAEMTGFNNLGFDYPIIHELMTNPYSFNYEKAHQLGNQIISAQNRGVRFEKIKHYERILPQIDWMKICHFDNVAKATSLKALQFAMRSESLEDLPFKVRPLNNEEKDTLRKYCVHDVTETEKFGIICEPLLEMRRELLKEGVLTGDVLNFSDVKIGTEYLINRIGKQVCFSGYKPRQTYRDVVEFNRIILPKIFYRTEAYNSVFSWFKNQKIFTAGGEKPSLCVKLSGLDFHFGVGGVHASADNKVFESNNDYQIVDIDVTGMYVSVAIANGFAPEHLGSKYVASYKQIKEDRARYAKGTSRNAVLKLAGNGVYGNSNNPFSPFYDPQYTFSVTINGQLQILQLVELLELVPNCELIQANTDGITVRVKKDSIPFLKLWCKEWESLTGLELEEVLYSRMWIRDVNNYLAEKMNGELKRKGAYWYPTSIKEYEGWWNKDYSNLASKMIAEKYMTHSWSLEMIKIFTDPFDFMLRYKATSDSVLYIGDKEQLKTVRYYVSKTGQPMKKVSPPRGEVGQYKRKNKITDDYFNSVMKEIGKNVWDDRIHTKNKSKYGIVETSIQSGWKVKQCNIAKDFDWNDVDWSYYIEEAKKLLVGVKHV